MGTTHSIDPSGIAEIVIRGLPALFVRQDLDLRSRIALGLLSATQLPLVVAIAEIGVKSNRLKEETAASLVGAGMVSVLLFPLLALTLRRMAVLRQHAGGEPYGNMDTLPVSKS